MSPKNAKARQNEDDGDIAFYECDICHAIIFPEDELYKCAHCGKMTCNDCAIDSDSVRAAAPPATKFEKGGESTVCKECAIALTGTTDSEKHYDIARRRNAESAPSR